MTSLLKLTMLFILYTSITCVSKDISQEEQELMDQINKIPINQNKELILCETTKGNIEIEVDFEWAPVGAARFVQLVQEEYFTDMAFYDARPDFLVKFGISNDNIFKDSLHWSNQPISRERFNFKQVVKKHYISFISDNNNVDARTHHFYIALVDLPYLSGDSPFGRIVKGRENFDNINTEYEDEVDLSLFMKKGNAYLRKEFPRLDYIKKCTVITKPEDNKKVDPKAAKKTEI